MSTVQIVGAGLAGCEAAWQLARRGVSVRLWEMKPRRFSPAHKSEGLAELVCSNSLRSDQRHHAVGLLHEEMRQLGSLILEAADLYRVPAGGALAVDRELFSAHVTERLEGESRIEIVREEVTRLPEGWVIVATGPLTSDALARELGPLCGESLYFYDAISPTVYLDSLALEPLFRGSRYREGEGDYWNIPLDEWSYRAFVHEIVRGETVPFHNFEEPHYFEGCLPIEVMAERGEDTLRFGPMKPVGLRDPRTGLTPFAVVQLRQEDKRGTLYNLVGFQTKLRIGEQKRVFRSLPGMRDAVFARYGSVHRNTFIRSPLLLDGSLQHRARSGLYFAGQIAGVEGYVESAALGLFAGIEVAHRLRGDVLEPPPATSALGALLRHLREGDAHNFQPMNVNYGLFPPLEDRARRTRRRRHEQLSARALDQLSQWVDGARP